MSTYSYLVTDLKNTAENDSTEFADQIPYFINKAELQLTKDLDDFGLDVFTTITLSASNPIVSIPSGTRLIRNVNYTTSVSSIKTNLLQRTYEYAIDYFPYASASTGTPRYYARKNNTQIYIVPTPASTVTGEIQTVVRPSSLTSAAPTNYYSEFCYNALFYRCMFEANFFMKNWEVSQVWEAQYKNAIDGLRNQARRTRQDDMETPRNPLGGPDTIIQGSQ
jgi:hypothetical protein|tara:strand:+ start:343 stop:1008 length:666 start_codon:yes stop_codon:yes gene_type:complete